MRGLRRARPSPRPRPPSPRPRGGGGRRRGGGGGACVELAPHPAFGHPLPARWGEGTGSHQPSHLRRNFSRRVRHRPRHDGRRRRGPSRLLDEHSVSLLVAPSDHRGLHGARMLARVRHVWSVGDGVRSLHAGPLSVATQSRGDREDGARPRASITNRIVFEFFKPPSDTLIELIDHSITHWGAELSPESHDEDVRMLLGKARYTNEELEKTIDSILAHRCEQLDLFYMIGLPGQTYRNVLAMLDRIEELFIRFDRRLSAFITPMGPFIDPGSDGFERAEANGYKIRARTLAEHRALLEQHDWESILNYETKWMTRSEIVDATYDSAERLNELKARFGRITRKVASGVAKRLAAARVIREKLKSGEIDGALRGEIRKFSEGTINDKGELFPPGAFLRNFRIGGILRLLLSETKRRATLRECSP